jgi:lipooligosaccharide transport system ATP-binding protein
MRDGEVAIRADGLTKRYGELIAVNGIEFSVNGGECVGFLGPNGAGKTTTVRMVACFTPITSGAVSVLGFDVSSQPREVKSRLGICPQEDNLDPDFSVTKNLTTYARYFGIQTAAAGRRAAELLAMMQLEDKARSKIQELSGGMKRRLILARALLNQPSLLLLDEPTTGLDPQARHLIWQKVRGLKSEGTSILLTTHYMEEASQLCDRVVLMDAGKILLSGSPRDLIAREIGGSVLEMWNYAPDLHQFVEGRGWAHEVVDERIHIYLPQGVDGTGVVNERFPGAEHLLRAATLEDVFLRRAGRALRD